MNKLSVSEHVLGLSVVGRCEVSFQSYRAADSHPNKKNRELTATQQGFSQRQAQQTTSDQHGKTQSDQSNKATVDLC